MRVRELLFVCCMGTVWVQPLQGQEQTFTVSAKFNYTTGSQLFPNPNSPNEIERAQFFSLEDFFGYSVELRYHFPESNLALGISADYISATRPQSIQLSPSRSIPVEDGYRVIPLEVTAYFFIPVAGRTVEVYMGGGVGTYIGERIYRIADVEAASTGAGQGFGIHVLGGVGYSFTDWFSLTGEMKFRDVQFTSSNKFSVSQITYNNTVVNVGLQPRESRVHTDGIVFQLGANISF